MSPFKALYGQEYLTPLRLASLDLFVSIVKETLKDMDCQLQIISKILKRARDRQKICTDLKQSTWRFDKGDKVLLRVKPKKSSLKLGKHKKLAYRFCKPYQITKRVGEQAYDLELIPYLHVHNVFDVSLLKQYKPLSHFFIMKIIFLFQRKNSRWNKCNFWKSRYDNYSIKLFVKLLYSRDTS